MQTKINGVKRIGIKAKLLVGFVLLEIIDIFPFPITTLVAVYIVLRKPLWFKRLVMELYETAEEPSRNR